MNTKELIIQMRAALIPHKSVVLRWYTPVDAAIDAADKWLNDNQRQNALINAGDCDGITYDGPSFERGYKLGEIAALYDEDHDDTATAMSTHALITQMREANSINLDILKNVKPHKGQEDLLADAISMAKEVSTSADKWLADVGREQQGRTTGWLAPKDRYAVPVLFNPHTGAPRDVRDVQSDPQGVLITPPEKVEMLAAAPTPLTKDAQGPCGYDETTGNCTNNPCCQAAPTPPVKDAEPYGYLYDWTHSSALGKPNETFTGFAKDRAYAECMVGSNNVRAVFAAPPNTIPAAVARQALEALELSQPAACGQSDDQYFQERIDHQSAITALRKALP